MSNIYQLQQFISTYRTYNEVKDKAFQIDPLWREQSWTRALRELSEDKIGKPAIIRPVRKENKPNSPVIGYEPLNVTTGLVEPKKTTSRGELEQANEQLNIILKRIRVCWENSGLINEINYALKSKNIYYKKAVISQYQ